MYASSMKLNWCFHCKNSEQLTHDQKSQLDDAAVARITEMCSQGYREGELCTELDGAEVRGWWRVEA